MEKDISKKQDNPRGNEFVEQEAPEKNTDNAFVKVGKDGQPEIPGKQDNDKKEPDSLRHR